MIKPKAPIRRFDVFAEYNRQKALAKGQPSDEAAGYGLWVAKIVAARKFRRERSGDAEDKNKGERRQDEREELIDGKWHALRSRIVAMSFCEPRSWKRILSS